MVKLRGLKDSQKYSYSVVFEEAKIEENKDGLRIHLALPIQRSSSIMNPNKSSFQWIQLG